MSRMWPEIARPDAGTVLVTESASAAAWEGAPWPAGLLSFTEFAATDGGTVLTYTQWANGEADRAFLAGLTGAEPVAYEPHPGGISGHFHVSDDGMYTLNHAEWTDEQAPRDAVESSGQGSADWRGVQESPGVKSGQARRYHLLRSLPAPAEEVLDSPTGWVAQHIRSYVDSNGQKGHLYHGMPTLLLTTRGRKSGLLRRTALIYGRDGDRHLLVASNGGSAQHPAWYLNLTAHPDVTVQVGGDTFGARARVATPQEKRELWPVMAKVFPRYDTYQEATERDLPLVILERS